MFCHECGTENSDEASFCKQCGTKLGADANLAADNAEPVQAAVVGAQAASAQDAAQNTQQAAPAQDATQNTQQAAPNAQYAPNAQAAQPYAFKIRSDNVDNKQYVASAFGSGWADISNSEGWFVRSLLLALCSLVPILSWVVTGFAARWGREVCIGVNRRLPQSIFEQGTFVTGAKIFVVNLLYGLIFFAAFFIFMLIPILGPIVWVCALILFGFISPLLDIQVGLSGKISAGFTGLGRAFKLLSDKPLKTLITTVAPSLVANGVVFVITAAIGGIIFLIMCGTALGSVAGTALISSGNSAYLINSGLANLAGIFTGSIFLLYIIWFIFQIAGAVSTVWTYRSIGHFIAREAPEWLAVPELVDVSNIDVSSGTFKPFIPFQE